MFAYMSSDDADDDAKRRQTKVWAEGKGCNQFELILSLGNLTLQWKIHYVQVHFLFGNLWFPLLCSFAGGTLEVKPHFKSVVYGDAPAP